MFCRVVRVLIAICCCSVAGAQPAPADPGGIAGIVLDAANTPIRRAIVTLSTVEASPQDAVAWTNADGRFSFGHVPAGRYQLRVNKDGYQAGVYGTANPRAPAGIINLAAGTFRNNFVFHLQGMSSISGVVLDDDGEPVGGVQVKALRPGFKRRQRGFLPGPAAMTDPTGRYRFNGIAPGHYAVAVAGMYSGVRRINAEVAAGEAPQRYVYGLQYYPGSDRADSAAVLEVQPGQEIPSIDFRLVARPAASLHGKIILPMEAASATSVSVNIVYEDLASEMNFGAAASPPAYAFGFEQLPSGSYILIAQASVEGKVFRGTEHVTIGPERLDGVEIALEPGVDLAGHVTVEGPDAEKYSGGSVALFPGDGVPWNALLPRAPVNKDGSFKIAGVPPGVWDIDVTPIPRGGYLKSMRLGDEDVLTQDMTINASTEAELKIVLATQAATVEGNVVQGDEPARGVVLLAPEEKFRHVLSFYRFAATDEKGHFEIKNAPAGRYQLFAFDELEQPAVEDPEFLKPFESAGIAVTLREGVNDSQTLSRVSTAVAAVPKREEQPQTAGPSGRGPW